MNPELRAQLEKLDVWHLTLAAQEKNKAKQTEEEKRQAWQAYYACELSKARQAAQNNETEATPSIYIPHCFREIAAQNGIFPEETTPAKMESVVPRGLDGGTVQLKEIADLQKEVANKSLQLNALESDVQSASMREQQLMERIRMLEEELVQLKNNCTALTAEKEELSSRLVQTVEENASLLSHNQSLQAQEASLQEDIVTLRKQIESQVHEIQGDSFEDIDALKAKLAEATAQSEKACTELEEMSVEKDAVLSKMKHAKEQFDKLRQQSRDRNAENEALKAEIEQLRAQASREPNVVQDCDALQRLLDEAKAQHFAAEDRGVALEKELESLTDTLTEKVADLEKLNAQVHDSKVIQASLEQKVLQADAELDSVKKLLEQCQQELEIKDNECTRQLALADAERLKQEDALQQKTAEIEDLSEILDQREQEMEALQYLHQDVVAAKEQLVAKDTQLEEHGNEITALRSQIDELEEDKSGIKSAFDDQAEVLSKREAEILTLKGEFHEFMLQVDQLNEQVGAKSSELNEKTAHLHKLSAELEDARRQKQDTIQEKASEVDRLAEKIQEYLTEIDTLQNKLETQAEELTSRDATISDLYEQLDRSGLERNHQLEELGKEKEELVLKLKAAEKEKEDAASLNSRVAEAERLCAAARSREEAAGQQIKELDVALNEALEIAELADAESRRASSEKHQCQRELQSAQNQLHELQESIAAKTADVSRLQSLLSRKEVEVESLKTRFQTADSQLKDVTSELEAVRHEWNVTQRSLTEANEKRHEITQLKAHVRAAEDTTTEMQNAKDQIQTELLELQKQMDELSSQLQASQVEEQEKKSQLEATRQHEHELLEQIQSLKNKALSADALPELQQQLSTVQAQLYQARSQNQSLSEEMQRLKSHSEDVSGLQQKIMRLETALAVAGQAQQPIQSPKESAELQALQQRAAQAEAREADLYAEVESLRIALEETRKQNTALTGAGPSDAVPLVGGMSNKKDEDRGYDVEAAVLSGGDPSGFQPLSGLLRGVRVMKYLSLCIKGADFVDRGFILLMRHPMIRYVLLVYFTVLHLLIFV